MLLLGCLGAVVLLGLPRRTQGDALASEVAEIRKATGIELPAGAIVAERAVSRASIDPVFFWMVEVPADQIGMVRSVLERQPRSAVTIMGNRTTAPAWWAPCEGDESAQRVFEFGGSVIRVSICGGGERVRVFIERITF